MQPGSMKRGEMSQAFRMTEPHQNDVRTEPVPSSAAEPARGTRLGKSQKTFTTLSATSIGLEFGVCVIIGVLFGMWLDSKLGTSPWLMVLFIILGFAAGVRSVMRGVKRAERDEQEGRLG